MKRVLIIRPEPGATQTATRIRALGLHPIVAPIVAITPVELRCPRHVAATLLTSRNVVRPCPVSLHRRPAFAVGTATATLATEAGFDHVFNADGNANSLAELVAQTLSPDCGALFLPTGQGQGKELASLLRQRGFRVIRRVAYRAIGVATLPPAAVTALIQSQVAVVLFFSGEASRHFVRLLRAAELADAVCGVEAVSISEPAAVPLRLLQWRRISVASRPNQDAMLVLLND